VCGLSFVALQEIFDFDGEAGGETALTGEPHFVFFLFCVFNKYSLMKGTRDWKKAEMRW